MKTSDALPRLTETEKALRDKLSRAVKPKLASTIVITHGDPHDPHILMGKRAKRHDFMPSVFVFPGGRVDRSDSYAPWVGGLSKRTERILEAAYSPRRARACVLAAIRETWEETGVWIARDMPFKRNINDPGWDAFRRAGKCPDLDGIEVFGRAITPPHRHKRFDAWFFIRHFDGPRPEESDSAELQDVGWYQFRDMNDLPMQRATTMMLSALQKYLEQPAPPSQIFFSRMMRGKLLNDGFPAL